MATTPPDPAHELPVKDFSKDSGRPQDNSGTGRVDVTGKTPDNIRVDPDITEGHPGYQESGDSEIIPNPPPQDRTPGQKQE
jgi:hypothetical protein